MQCSEFTVVNIAPVLASFNLIDECLIGHSWMIKH